MKFAVLLALLAGLSCTRPGVKPTAPISEPPSIGTIEHVINCSARLRDANVYYNQSVAIFSNGSVWLSVTVASGGTSSNMATFYAPYQVGAGTLVAIVVHDVVGKTNYGYWEVGIDVNKAESTLTYFDGDLPEPKTWVLPLTSCRLNGVKHA